MIEQLYVSEEIMQRLRNIVRRMRQVLIGAAVTAVLLVPVIVLSAISGIVVLTVFVSILCGVCGIVGSYGWIVYGVYRTKSNLLTAIGHNHLSTVQEMSDSLGVSRGVVRKTLFSLISGGYLPGWKMDRERTQLISTTRTNHKCPNCGAPHPPESKRCDHCNAVLRA